MKAPKNFYNTVDQTKLGIDDLFARTAENEADITALETVVGDDTTGLVKSVSDLETVVGDDTTGLVKSVNDLETVVGDLDEGLVKDVHDLQTDSEQYHDDIADLKNADILINNRIDGHLLKETTTSADEGKIMIVDSSGQWILADPGDGGFFILPFTQGTGSNSLRFTISGYDSVGAGVTAALDSGLPILIQITQGTSVGYYFPENHSTSVILRYIELKGTEMLSRYVYASFGTSVTRTYVDGTYSVTVHGIPNSTASDAGKILQVNAAGNPEWVTPTP